MNTTLNIKYEIGDRVKIDWEGNYKVIGYEHVDGRWLRYILLHWTERAYQYETELELITEQKTIWFIKQ